MTGARHLCTYLFCSYVRELGGMALWPTLVVLTTLRVVAGGRRTDVQKDGMPCVRSRIVAVAGMVYRDRKAFCSRDP